jgi:hypothetical protein
VDRDMRELLDYVKVLEKENELLKEYGKVGWDFAYKLGSNDGGDLCDYSAKNRMR